MGNYKRKTRNNENDSGIYCITNIVNNKTYIGQTYSIKNRWYRHKNELLNNKHHNCHLQSAWNKYGSENFEFSILEYCSIDELNEKETFWIKKYDSFNNGYNLTSGDIGCRGYKHTEEEIAKMRNIYLPKKVLQLDSNFNIVNEFESCCQASKETGLYKQSLMDCCEKNNHVKSVGGFIWIYKEDYNTLEKSYYCNKNISIPKLVGQFNSKLELIKIWNSIYETEKIGGFSSATICQVCNHQRNSYKGYIWSFVDEDGNILDDYDYSNIKIRCVNKIQQCDTNGKILHIYDSLSDACKNTSFDKHYIADVCKGKRNSYKNYIWKYA